MDDIENLRQMESVVRQKVEGESSRGVERPRSAYDNYQVKVKEASHFKKESSVRPYHKDLPKEAQQIFTRHSLHFDKDDAISSSNWLSATSNLNNAGRHTQIDQLAPLNNEDFDFDETELEDLDFDQAKIEYTTNDLEQLEATLNK